MSLYLDANASSRLRPVAVEAIARFVGESGEVTNPSSVHAAGRLARTKLSAARQQIRGFFAGAATEPTIMFTSGATESCNAAIFGLLPELLEGRSAVISSIEHQAILEPAAWLQHRGLDVSFVTPARNGVHNAKEFISGVQPNCELVALMAANNVTGVLQPVIEVSELLRSGGYGGVILCDASQAAGKSDLNLGALLNAGVDAVMLSGHKLGVPSGTGALVLSGSICYPFEPLLMGGAQEQRFRAGTENLIGAVAFGAVAQFMIREGAAERQRMSLCREELWKKLSGDISNIERLSPEGLSLPNTLAVRFAGVRGDDFVVALDLAGVACSTGSACSSGRQETSHVFKALVGEAQARECVRFSLDWDATIEQVTRAATVISEVLGRVRGA